MLCPKCHADNPKEASYCRMCAALIPQSKTPKPDETVALDAPGPEITTGMVFADRFRVVEKIGSGGMGDVYKVVDEKIHDVVSLKIMKPVWAFESESVERFQSEIRLARRISHKNVCRVYDFGESGGRFYLTMEYVSGENLKCVLKMTHRLSVRRAVEIAGQVCEGLAEAYRLGIVHRDLKPGNIMIDAEGCVRIMDFGIAQKCDSEKRARGEIMTGTPEYMSPEQAKNLPVDARSDIYSLGVILYELTTGVLPFEGQTFIGIAAKHLSQKPRDPCELVPHIPGSLGRLILKCLEKDPAKRYRSADELLSELTGLAAQLRESEKRSLSHAGPVSRIVSGVLRGQRLTGLTAALLVVLAGLSVATMRKGKPLPPPNSKVIAVLPFENLGSPQDEYISDGITDEVTSRLANLPGLSVISRTSAMTYKKSRKTVPQIGRELGADYILEGAVRSAGIDGGRGAMRITPQLIRVADDTHVWSETYDKSAGDIFALQSQIAEQVARRLDVEILEPARRALMAKPTGNLLAYDLYLKGRDGEDKAWNSWKFQDLKSALQMYEQAADLDPDFVLAQAQASILHSRIYFFGFDKSESRLQMARLAAERALRTKPDLPESQLALAVFYYWGLQDYDRALEVLESIRMKRPNLPLEMMGYIWRRQGFWEKSTKTLEEAFTFNPRYPQLAYEIGLCYMAMRNYGRADEWFDRALAINPELLAARLQKGAIPVLAEGNARKARSLLESAPPNVLTSLMRLAVGMAERDFREVLAQLAAIDVETYEGQHLYFQKDLAYASVYYAMGDRDSTKRHAEQAKSAIEKVLAQRPGDPRFHAALGLACAYLGLGDKAVEEGLEATRVYPVTKDAAQGYIYVHNLARIHSILGNKPKAVEYLRDLLGVASCEYLWDLVSIPYLQVDPQWDTLRANPDFQVLIGSAGPAPRT